MCGAFKNNEQDEYIFLYSCKTKSMVTF